MKQILIIAILIHYLYPFSGSSLFHEKPFDATMGEDLTLSVLPLTDAEILDAKGYFRITGNLSYQEIPMIQEGTYWQMTIDGRLLSDQGIEYCFIFQLSNGAILAAPDDENPFEQPFSLSINSSNVANNSSSINQPEFDEVVKGDILILSPEPYSEISPRDAIIAVSLFNVTNIDSSSIQLLFNEKDVTDKAEISGGIIAFSPEKLDKGRHQVEILLSTVDGRTVQPTLWTFTVRKGSILSSQFEYRGEINTKVSSDIVGKNILNVAELNAKGKAKVEFADVNVNYRYTSRENPYSQPLNRSSFSINFMKYLDLKFGDFYESVTPYTIDGRRIRGISVDLNLRFFRAQIIRGQLNRSVQYLNKVDGGYSLLGSETAIDSLGRPVFTLDRKGYTFEKNVALTRLSVNLFDYHFGLHFMKANDDVNSINPFISNGNFYVDSADVTYDDSLFSIPIGTYSYTDFLAAVEKVNGSTIFPDKDWNGDKPQDNIVVGFDFGKEMDKERMRFDLSWNMSLYNRDIWDGVMTRAQLDTALDDTLDGLIATTYDSDGLISAGSMVIDTNAIFNPLDYESLFIMNINMSPLLPIDPNTWKTNPISTIVNMPSSAFHLKLSGNYRYSKFTIQYRQIGPEFVSLANPFLVNNIREFTLSDRLSFLDNKLMFNMAYKYRDDKILSTVEEPLKTNNISIGITFIPGPDSPSYVVNFQTIGKNNSKTDLERVGDSLVDLREDSKTNNSFFSVTYPFPTGRLKHNLNININTLTNIDQLSSDRRKDYFYQKSDSKMISTALSTRFNIPLQTVFNISRTTIQVPVQNSDGIVNFNELTWTSVNTNGSYSFWNNRLRVKGGISYLSNKGTTPIRLLGVQSGVEISLMNGLKALVTGNIQIRKTKIETAINTSGVLFSFRYNF